jgi:hypothetical protein
MTGVMVSFLMTLSILVFDVSEPRIDQQNHGQQIILFIAGKIPTYGVTYISAGIPLERIGWLKREKRNLQEVRAIFDKF